MNTTLEELKKNHYNNYKNAVIEIIKNNTLILVNEDIMSLLKKPPLESMDVIKNKYLDLAKKNNIVLDILVLDKICDKYRKDTFKICRNIIDIRLEILNNIEKSSKKYELIKINKKDLNNLNNKIKKCIKNLLLKYIEKDLYDNIDKVFSNDIDLNIKSKITNNIKKYFNNNYLKQLFENIDFKILVKDSILISGIKEQNDRYIFTLNNSHIFDVIE